MKKVLTSVFSVILSLFLAVSLSLGAAFTFLYHTLLDPQELLNVAEESKYTEELYLEIEDSFENLLAITGVSEPSPIMATLTREKLEADTFSYLRKAFQGKNEVDTEQLKEDLEEKLRAYVISQGEEEISKEVEENISELVASLADSYEKGIRIPLLPSLLGKTEKIRSYLIPAATISFVFSAVLVLFLFFLQKKKKETLYFAVIAAFTCALLFLGAAIFAEQYELIARLPLEVSALLTLFSAFLQHLFDKIFLIGVIFAIASAVMLLVYLILTFLWKPSGKEKSKLPKKEEKEEPVA